MPFKQTEIDNINVAAGFDLCCDAPTDRKRLEAALTHIENWFYTLPVGRSTRIVRSADCLPGKNYGPRLAAVLDAARKHLDTLPKPAWCVTGERPHGGGPASIKRDAKDEALAAARNWLEYGYTNVSVVWS